MLLRKKSRNKRSAFKRWEHLAVDDLFWDSVGTDQQLNDLV